MNKLSDAMIRTNKIIIHTYQFMRLWILNKYHLKLTSLYLANNSTTFCADL